MEITGYSGARIVSSDFAGLTGLTKLYITDSPQLTTVPANAFSEVTALTWLILHRNDIESVHEDAFNGLSSLIRLELLKNRVSSLHEDVFDELSNLENLWLNDNRIPSLHEDVFDGLSNLEDLILDGNYIKVLEDGIFDGLSSLENINLSHNLLSSLDEGAFDGLSSLEDLNLFNNRITWPHEDTFDGLSNLEKINLTQNNIESLDEDIFDGLTALRSLFLYDNDIESLEDGLFNGLTALDILYLNDNSITSLPADIFDGLTALRSLRLDSNSITSLEDDLFDGLIALQQLSLSDNSLTSLPVNIFEEPTALQYLYLHRNGITSLKGGLFDGLTALQVLFLNDNGITSLPVNIFEEPTALRTLNISDNGITSLDEDLFDGLTALEQLYLNDNGITSLDEDLFDGLTAQQYLYLNGNTLSSLPADLFDPLDDSLLLFLLTDNNVADLPAEIFDGLTGLRGLDLSCNYLTALDLTRFNPFATTLTFLDISGNEFTTAPTEAALQAKLTNAGLSLYTGANTVCAAPTDTGLSGVSISNGVISPAFVAPGLGSIYASVAHDVSTITITITARDSGAEIVPSALDGIYDNNLTMDGWQVDLPTYRNVFRWDVRSKSGVQTFGYQFHVFRDNPPASEARLRGLELSGVTLAETFGRGTFTYTAAAALTETTVTPILLDPNATAVIKLKGAEVPDGTVDLAMGSNTITVVVTAEDATTMQTYTVTVTVDAVNATPTLTDGASTTHTVPENSARGTNVGNPVTATDSDSADTLTYSLSGTDSRSFTINSSTGQIQTRSGITYNFEARNSYTVTVVVRDRKDTAGDDSEAIDDRITVNINLTDVNEAPVITNTATTATFAENGTGTVVDFNATDVDASTTLSWSVESADDGGKFRINSMSGELTFGAAPNFEAPTDVGMMNTYEVTVKITDNGSPRMSDTHKITITVTNVNEAPVITNTATTGTFAENGTGTVVDFNATDVDVPTTLTWSVEPADDGGKFLINSTSGELPFRNAPNFEAPTDTGDTAMNNTYVVTVKVTDNGSPVMSAMRAVTVTVNDVNERPVVSGNGTPSFIEIEYDADVVLNIGTYTAYDDDGDDVTWGVNGTDAEDFSINSTTGVLSFAERPNYEVPAYMGSNNVYNIVVEADDGSGETNSGGTFNVTVTVTNVDEMPEITGGNTAPSFAEIEYDLPSGDEVLTVGVPYTARDEESQDISWTLAGTDAADFSITKDTTTGAGVLSFRDRPNFEMPTDRANSVSSHEAADNRYEIIVRATDTASPTNTRLYPVTVTVTNVDETPEIVNPPADDPNFSETPYDSSVTPNVVATFTARDEETQDITWTLSGDDADDFTITKDTATGNGVVTFDDPPNFEMPLDADSRNTYQFTVRATDTASPTNTGTWEYAVTVTNINERPELTGTVTETHTYNENLTRDVLTYAARDEEGGVTWSLTGTDRRDFAISADGVVTFAATPDYEVPADSGGDNGYTFTVVATDTLSGSRRLSASVDVTVTVADVEEAGEISVSNPNPGVGDDVRWVLTDPDGGIVGGIEWTLQKRTRPSDGWVNSGTLNSLALSNQITVTVGEDDTGMQLRVVVKSYRDRRGSGKAAESEPTAAVTADPIVNAPPRFIDTTRRLAIRKGEAGRNVGRPLMATDRDGDTLTFGLGTGGISALFEINASSGQLSLAGPLDFETSPNAPERYYTVSVTLHDGEDADGVDEDPPVIDVQRIFSVYVRDVEEAGVVTFSAEDLEIGVALTATLADGDGSVSGKTWQWARSENQTSGFVNISGATSSSYTPDDDDGYFFLRATASYEDNRGSGKTADEVTTTRVPSENRRPAFPASEDGQRTVLENTRANRNIGAPVAATDPERDRLVYSLTGTNADAFTIVTSTGQLRTRYPLDFEMKASYSVTVNVHDGRDGSGMTSTNIDVSKEVIISIENKEEPGTVTLSTLTQIIQARVEVTAALSDPDFDTGVTWQWYGSPNGRTGWVEIQGATSDTYTPSDDEGRYIRATASYTDGHGPNKETHGVSPRRVDPPPPVNSAPAFPSTEDGQREVAENVAAATDLNAGDDEVNDPLVYSLSGTDAASFTIDAGTGQLRLAQDVTLDYEGKRSYRFTVEVTDGRDRSGDDDNDAIDATRNVTVTVTNVNEPPVVTGEETPSFEENDDSAVATYNARDPERDTLTWSVSGAEFIITDRGRLHFASPPSHEDRQTYQVTVTATDNDDVPLAGSLSVTVTVTDLEEEGVVAIAPPRGWVGTQFTVVLNDDDGGTTGISWQWERSTNRSTWTEIGTASNYTAAAEDVGNYLRATASYTDRRGSNKTAEAALTAPIGETRPTTTNTAPAFAADTDTRSIRQGTAAGRAIGSPVRATDADRDDVLTYALSGMDGDAFDIDAATGQLRTKAVLLDIPDDPYTVTVSVHDGFDDNYNPSTNQDDEIEVTIMVDMVEPPTAPGRVANLTATAQGTSQIDLAWSRPAGSRITGYRLERKTGSDSYSPVTPAPAAGGTTYEDTGLSAGTTYTYRLRAVNSAGVGSPSSEAEATTASPPQTRGAAAAEEAAVAVGSFRARRPRSRPAPAPLSI